MTDMLSPTVVDPWHMAGTLQTLISVVTKTHPPSHYDYGVFDTVYV